MKPEKKGQLIGGIVGGFVGGSFANILWGFSPPGGILILDGFGLGGFAGYRLVLIGILKNNLLTL